VALDVGYGNQRHAFLRAFIADISTQKRPIAQAVGTQAIKKFNKNCVSIFTLWRQLCRDHSRCSDFYSRLEKASIMELMMKTTLTTLSIAALTAATFSLPAAAANAADNAAKCGAKCSPAKVVKHNSTGTSGPGVTRQQVRAELEQAYARGELGTQRNGEFTQFPALTTGTQRK
jgi:hypothetical protein